MFRSVNSFVVTTTWFSLLSLGVCAQPGGVVFVAPAGQDIVGAGTQAQPFRSVSGALQTNLPPGTIIQLAPGTYSAETGETFPLKIPSGVVLRGDESGKGNGIVISGGGLFISPTFARQNVSILTEDNAEVRGITVTNSIKRGYGLWVESGKNVAIVNNSFVGTSHDGVFLTGDASATIAGNLFRGNRASGLSAVGESSGEIRENVFEDTGFGLSIGQKSSVALINNRIVNNRSGVVLSNLVTPKLRGNLIAKNREDGLVILKDRVSQPNPDLGTQGDPGLNIFQENAKKDINNVSKVKLPAFGNQVDPKKVVNIDLTGTVMNATEVLSLVPPSPAPLPGVKASNPPSTTVVPIERAAAPKALPPGGVAIKPVPSPTSNSPKPSTVQTIVVNKGNLPPVLPTPPVKPKPAMPQLSKAAAPASAFRFRVIVPIESEARTSQLKTIVPDAYVTRRNGEAVLQVGAYRQKQDAEAQLKKLAEAGFKARIDAI